MIMERRCILSALALVASTWLCAQAQVAIPQSTPEKEGMRPEFFDRAKTTIQSLVNNGKVAGATYAVLRHNKIVSQDAIGFQDLENGIKMRNDTIFRLFSQSKPLSSAAFLTLVEEGRVHLDDPLHLYLPEFRSMRVYDGIGQTLPADRPILIRHLLTHTAGFTYGFMDRTPVDLMYAADNILDKDEALTAKMRRLARLPLLAQPGTKWIYSVSTDVLGAIAEVVTGQRLDKFVQDRLLEPLGMVDTGFWVPPEKLSRFARVYERNSMGQLSYSRDETYNARPAFLSAGGGFVSTINDYMRFALMLANEGSFNGRQILRSETVRSMLSNHLAPELLPMRYNPNFSFQNAGFGYGISVTLRANPDDIFEPADEVSWGGALSTNFFVSRRDETIILYMLQIKPYSEDVKLAIRPATYQSVISRSPDVVLPAVDAYVDPFPVGIERVVPAADPATTGNNGGGYFGGSFRSALRGYQ